MKCPPAWRLAAAASGQDEAAALHAEACVDCSRVIHGQCEIVELAALVNTTRRAPLAYGARAELGAAIMASEVVAPPHRVRWLVAAGAFAAAAAAAAALVTVRHVEPTAPVQTVPIAIAPMPPIPPAPAPTIVEPAVPRSPVAPIAAPAVAAAAPAAPREIAARDGELTLDTRGQGDTRIVHDGATVAIASGHVQLSTSHGVVISARVFDGSMEIVDGGKRIVVMAGDVWVRPEPARVPDPTVASSSIALFKTGWEALHAGRNLEAIDAFDRAVDPTIREDAMFWAAIAAERAGDRTGAARRMRAFVEEFPSSHRADDARATIERLDSLDH